MNTKFSKVLEVAQAETSRYQQELQSFWTSIQERETALSAESTQAPENLWTRFRSRLVAFLSPRR